MSGFSIDLGKPAASPTTMRMVQPVIKDRRVSLCEALSFSGSMFEVKVGNGDIPTTYFVHQPLIILRSKFFKRIAVSTWQQDKEEVVALPDVDTNTFRLYLNLVYANHLATKGMQEWLNLCRLYVLVEKLEDKMAKNQIIDGMHAFFHESILKNFWSASVAQVFPAEAIQELYDGTSDKSQARKLVIDLYSDSGNESWLCGARAKLPVDFVYDVAVRLLQKRASNVFGTSINRPSSYYHEVNAETTPQKAEETLEELGSSFAIPDTASEMAWIDPPKPEKTSSTIFGSTGREIRTANRILKAMPRRSAGLSCGE